MDIILITLYIISVIVTINRYRFVSKNCKHLSNWNTKTHVENLFWMLVPIVNLVILIEALEVIWVYKQLEE